MTLNIVQSLINMTFRKYSQLSWPKSYKSVTDVLSGTILILVLDPPLHMEGDFLRWLEKFIERARLAKRMKLCQLRLQLTKCFIQGGRQLFEFGGTRKVKVGGNMSHQCLVPRPLELSTLQH